MQYSKKRAVYWTGTCYHKEQLMEIINHKDVKDYAYILHDKDIIKETGEKKKPHYHFLIKLYNQQRGSWFKQYESDDKGQVMHEASYAPEGAHEYLTHETAKAKKDKKHIYDKSELTTTFEKFDKEEKEKDENDELYEDLMELVYQNISWHEFIKKKPKRIHMIGNIRTAYNLIREELYNIKTDENK